MQSESFQDFDAFAHSVRGVQCTMMLQNPEEHRWSTDSVTIAELRVQIGRLGSGNIVEGQSIPDGVLVYMPLTASVDYAFNGSTLPRNAFGILEPGREFCISTKFAHDWCSAFVPCTHLHVDVASRRSSSWTTRSNQRLAERFRAIVRNIMIADGHSTQFDSTPAAQSASATLVQCVARIAGTKRPLGPHHVGRPRLPRDVIINRARAILDDCNGLHVHVGQLASAAGVSERTLRTAFNEYFGVGPVRYLQLRQLHQVRRILLAARSDELSVTDALVHNGVWEFSRFARRYRQLFGERPLDTLQSSADRTVVAITGAP